MIRSAFYGFSTALSGLKASQTALDVVGQNVSNTNTSGYTRQRVVQSSVAVSITAGRYGSSGSPITGQGARITDLGQIRDSTLDARFRTENASVGYYDAELGGMENIETIFDEAITSGMRDSILGLQTAFQNLSLNAGSDEYDALARSSATSMSKLFNQYSQQLTDSYNAEIYDFENGSVADVNSLLSGLATAGTSIRSAEVSGGNPLELYDLRNTMLDQLSSYFDMDYSYEVQTLAPDIHTSVLHVYMKDSAGGQISLINGDQYAQLGVSVDEGADADSIMDNRVRLMISPLTSAEAATFDEINESAMSSQHPAGMTSTDVTPVYGTDAGGNTLKNPTALTNGVLKGTLDMLNAAGDYETGGCTIRGYKYYVGALDTLAGTMASQMNDQNTGRYYTTDGRTIYGVYDADGNSVRDTAGKAVYAMKNTAGDDVYGNIAAAADGINYAFTELTGGSYTGTVTEKIRNDLFTADDGVTTGGITAASISVSNAWLQGTVRIVSTTKFCAAENDISGDNSNTLRFVKLFENNTDFNTTSGIRMFTGGYEDFVSAIGDQSALDVKTQTTTYDSYNIVLKSVDSDRQSVSGVSLDEEAVDIYKYQRAYQAASRVMTTMDELLDKLINGTGAVGR